jgi:hypothetical protein
MVSLLEIKIRCIPSSSKKIGGGLQTVQATVKHNIGGLDLIMRHWKLIQSTE